MGMGDQVRGLVRAGWKVELAARVPLSAEILGRYPWLPRAVREVAESTAMAANTDETAWLLTSADYAGKTSSAYAWNEWEAQSLEAATGDETWMRSIVAFWDAHFPFLLSVKSGYAYFAVEQASLAVVVGEGPEFEETTRVASSVPEFLVEAGANAERLRRWL